MNQLRTIFSFKNSAYLKTVTSALLAVYLTVHWTISPAFDHQENSKHDERPSYETVLTCGVYYRMVAGQLRKNQNDVLAADAIGTMHVFIEKGRDIGSRKGLTATDFDSDWSDKVGEMTDRINRNYANIRQLKSRYAQACAELLP